MLFLFKNNWLKENLSVFIFYYFYLLEKYYYWIRKIDYLYILYIFLEVMNYRVGYLGF